MNSSITSNVGNGAVILTNPDAPLSLSNIVSQTSASMIAFKWSPGIADGGKPVLDYRISWD